MHCETKRSDGVCTTGIFDRYLPAIMHYIHEYRVLRARALTLPKDSAAYGREWMVQPVIFRF